MEIINYLLVMNSQHDSLTSYRLRKLAPISNDCTLSALICTLPLYAKLTNASRALKIEQ